MISTTLALLSLIALGAAQSSSTVSLYLPFLDPRGLVASIAGSDATATSYVVGCASSNAAATTALATADASGFYNINECGFDSSFTVVQGPSTVHYVFSTSDYTESLNCQLMGKTQAICTGSSTGAAISGDTTEPPVQTATVSGSEVTFVPVVVTAGAATGKQTGSNATPSATAKSTASTISGSTSSTASTASTASTKTSTSSTSSASAQGTNAAMQASPAYGAGVLGALGVVVAGAML